MLVVLVALLGLASQSVVDSRRNVECWLDIVGAVGSWGCKVAVEHERRYVVVQMSQKLWDWL